MEMPHGGPFFTVAAAHRIPVKNFQEGHDNRGIDGRIVGVTPLQEDGYRIIPYVPSGGSKPHRATADYLFTDFLHPGDFGFFLFRGQEAKSLGVTQRVIGDFVSRDVHCPDGVVIAGNLHVISHHKECGPDAVGFQKTGQVL
jgi:hypothetical protein